MFTSLFKNNSMSRPPPFEEGDSLAGRLIPLAPVLEPVSTDPCGPLSDHIKLASQMKNIDWDNHINSPIFPPFEDGYGEDYYYDEKDKKALNAEASIVLENEILNRQERRSQCYSQYLKAKAEWEKIHNEEHDDDHQPMEHITLEVAQEGEGDFIYDPKGTSYQLLKELGSGRFGTVFSAKDLSESSYGQDVLVAIKKTYPSYYYRQQAQKEVQIMEHIQKLSTAEEMQYINNIKDWFIYQDSLWIVSELMGMNLLDLLEKTKYKHISLVLIQSVLNQLLHSLVTLEKCQIVHSDIKPENIVLFNGKDSSIKLIDFGSARYISQPCISYIQSRYYRAPEVVLGLQHDYKIDIWSVSCVAFELFAGCPLLPGQSEIHLLELIVNMFGQFPEEMVDASPRKDLFNEDKTLKTEQEICALYNQPVVNFHHYFQVENLDSIIFNYPYFRKKGDSMVNEKKKRILFIDFLKKTLSLNPYTRLSAKEALLHPFITSDLNSL